MPQARPVCRTPNGGQRVCFVSGDIVFKSRRDDLFIESNRSPTHFLLLFGGAPRRRITKRWCFVKVIPTTGFNLKEFFISRALFCFQTDFRRPSIWSLFRPLSNPLSNPLSSPAPGKSPPKRRCGTRFSPENNVQWASLS
jgi:hypothetical protein